MLTLFPSQPDMEALQSVSVIGVGGAGTHILNELLPITPGKTDLVTVNTDSRLSSFSQVPTKIRIGSEVTHGLNCGGDPNLGREAAEAALSTLAPHLSGKDMVFLTAGLGGGTGSGVAPVLARKIRESGAFLISFVSLPFSFEGSRKITQARNALNELFLYSNMVLIFENDKMSTLVSEEEGVQEAFTAANSLIAEAIAFISRMCLKPGIISMGLPDIADVLGSEIGRCLFGYGSASGYERAATALQKALNCPLLSDKKKLKEAEEILVHLTGGKDLSLEELEFVVERLTAELSPDVYIHLGATIEETLSGLSLVIMAGDKSQLPSLATITPAAHEEPRPTAIPAPITPPSTEAPTPVTTPTISAHQPTSPTPELPTPSPSESIPTHAPIIEEKESEEAEEEEALAPSSPGPVIRIGEEIYSQERTASTPPSEPLPVTPVRPSTQPSNMPHETERYSHEHNYSAYKKEPTHAPVPRQEERIEPPVSAKINEEIDKPAPPQVEKAPPEIQSELTFPHSPQNSIMGEESSFIDDAELDLPPSLRKNKGL